MTDKQPNSTKKDRKTIKYWRILTLDACTQLLTNITKCDRNFHSQILVNINQSYQTSANFLDGQRYAPKVAMQPRPHSDISANIIKHGHFLHIFAALWTGRGAWGRVPEIGGPTFRRRAFS
eukprot:6077788-Amphidinium_carterae.1